MDTIVDELPEDGQHRGRIIPVNIEEQMKSAYIDYSMSVIVCLTRCPGWPQAGSSSYFIRHE